VADAVTTAVARIGTPAGHAPPVEVAVVTQRVVSGNPEARDLYERARYLVQVRNNEGLAKGIALLEQSIALDPDFAPAHTQLGIARSAFYGIMARPTLPAFREVEASARRALALDPPAAGAVRPAAAVAVAVRGAAGRGRMTTRG
jgi:hypothetical protein